MIFRILGGTRGARATFVLEAPDGTALLRGGPFEDRETAADAVRAAIAGLGDAGRLDVVPEGGGVIVVLEGDGGALARSVRLPTEGEGRALRDRVLAAAAERESFEVLVPADGAAPKPPRAKPAQGAKGKGAARKVPEQAAARDQYRLDLLTAGGAPGFVTLRQPDDRRYYFVFNDDDGRPLLYSQGYQGQNGRDRGVRSLIRHGAEPGRARIHEVSGRYFFTLNAGNHQEISRSRWFSSEAQAREAADLVAARLSACAGAYGVEIPPHADPPTIAAARPAPAGPEAGGAAEIVREEAELTAKAAKITAGVAEIIAEAAEISPQAAEILAAAEIVAGAAEIVAEAVEIPAEAAVVLEEARPAPRRRLGFLRAIGEQGLEILRDIDAIVDRVDSAFQAHVTPVVQAAAGWLDGAVSGAGDRAVTGVRRAGASLDDRYQRWVIERFDPLFGATRTQQLAEMGPLEVSPGERDMNRRIAASMAAFLAIVTGRALFPPSLLVTVPLSSFLVLPVYGDAVRSVKQQRRLTYQVVSALNVTTILLGGFFAPLLGATILFYLGEKLLLITEDRSRKSLTAVFSQQPRAVWVIRQGVEVEQPLAEIASGDVVVVSGGEAIPVDGTVVSGVASIDQQILTGEAQPVEKGPGDPVFAATLVLAGRVHVRVDKAGTDTMAARVGEILNRTESYQIALQSRGIELANDSALPTLGLTAGALLLRGPEPALAMLNSAFGVSVRVSAPITMLNLFNIASSKDILLKDGRSLELLSAVDTVVFDKSGTLTLARPSVAGVHRTGGLDEHDILMMAAAAERRQSHPIAQSIVEEAAARGIFVPEIEEARYDVGYGVTVRAGGLGLSAAVIQVGSDRFMRQEGIAIPDEVLALREASDARGSTLVLVAVNRRVEGAIELDPTIRPEAEAVIDALRRRGLHLSILSGDREGPTRRLAERLGMDAYFAEVLPEGKASVIEDLQARGRSVCFVGDGINDAIALKKAHVSVSLRGATTVATDAAQVVLMEESLSRLPFVFELADDMERSLRWGDAAGTVPGVINAAGVLLLGWGFYPAIGLSMASLAAGMAIALYPQFKHRGAAAGDRAAPALPARRLAVTAGA